MQISKWIDFGTWVSHFETCNSVNSKDGIRAGIKASCLNRDGVNRSADYVLLADFANTVGIVFGSSFSVQSSITSSSTVSASQDSYIGGRLSVSDSSCLNTLNMASSVTVRSFVRLGSFLSVNSSSAAGIVLSVRGLARLGSGWNVCRRLDSIGRLECARHLRGRETGCKFIRETVSFD